MAVCPSRVRRYVCSLPVCLSFIFAAICPSIFSPRNQHLIKTSIPTSTNYVSPKDPPGGPSAPNFVMQHECAFLLSFLCVLFLVGLKSSYVGPGAVDFTSYLCIPTCLEFRSWLGGEEKINNYCRCLAIDGGRRLARMFDTRVMDETPHAQLTLNMVCVPFLKRDLG